MCINYFSFLKVFNNMSFFNNNNAFDNPSLTEPGVKYFLTQTLKQCHNFKQQYNNTLYNILIIILFFIILGILLLYKYKGKLSVEEIKEKEYNKKVYVLSKIKTYQQERVRSQQELITGLPHWENDV